VVKVKVLEVDKQGRIRLSMKAVKKATPPAPSNRTSDCYGRCQPLVDTLSQMKKRASARFFLPRCCQEPLTQVAACPAAVRERRHVAIVLSRLRGSRLSRTTCRDNRPAAHPVC
jgi:hypothetical protein